MKDGMVTLKMGKTTIICKPEDVAGIMASVGSGVNTLPQKPLYEKSSILHKAIRSIQADDAEDLVLKALKGRVGVHTVYSGLNQELRDRFGADPVEISESLINKGLINGRPAKGGFYITLK